MSSPELTRNLADAFAIPRTVRQGWVYFHLGQRWHPLAPFMLQVAGLLDEAGRALGLEAGEVFYDDLVLGRRYPLHSDSQLVSVLYKHASSLRSGALAHSMLAKLLQDVQVCHATVWRVLRCGIFLLTTPLFMLSGCSSRSGLHRHYARE